MAVPDRFAAGLSQLHRNTCGDADNTPIGGDQIDGRRDNQDNPRGGGRGKGGGKGGRGHSTQSNSKRKHAPESFNPRKKQCEDPNQDDFDQRVRQWLRGT